VADILPMSNPSNYKLAYQRIKRLWNEGNTEISYHAQQRMKQRKLDMNDIANCIRYGRIIEHAKPMTYWRYTILGKAWMKNDEVRRGDQRQLDRCNSHLIIDQ
jgi:hypothetical protein